MSLLLYDYPVSRLRRRHRRMDLSSLLSDSLDWPSLRMDPLDDLLYLKSLQPQASHCGRSEVANSPDKFKVQLDVSQYKFEELSVKTVDGAVVIRGKHEKRDEHGWLSQEFNRRFMLPPDVDLQALTSTLTAEGVLTLEAPKKQLEHSQEKVIPITVEKSAAEDNETKDK